MMNSDEFVPVTNKDEIDKRWKKPTVVELEPATSLLWEIQPEWTPDTVGIGLDTGAAERHVSSDDTLLEVARKSLDVCFR